VLVSATKLHPARPAMASDKGSAEAADEEPPSVAETIDAIGFGLYQVHVFILCAGAVVAEVAGLQTAAGLSSAILQEHKIKSDLAQEAQMLATYVGFALGTLSSGCCGDVFGRRLPVLLAYSGMLLSALGLYLATSYGALCFGFGVYGFFSGLGIPAAFIALAEVCPTRLRGVINAAMAMAFCGGEIFSAVGFRLVLPDLIGKGWKGMLLWIGLPPFVLLCLAFLSPVTRFDTPHFLSARGRRTELVEAIRLMATMNWAEVPVTNTAEAATPAGEVLGITEALASLTSRKQSLGVLALSVMFFVKDLAFYGMGNFWPLAWRKTQSLAGARPATELLVTASLGVPGVAVAMLLTFALPRRVAFSASASLCAVGVYAVHGILDKDLSLGLTGVVFFKLFYPTAQMTTFLLPSEVFTTQIRVWSMSIIAFCGRMAPLAVPMLIHSSTRLFLYLTMGLLLLAALLVWSLPETKDQELVDAAETRALAKTGGKEPSASYGSAAPPAIPAVAAAG